MGIILMLFCVVAAGALAYVYMFTQPKIEQNVKIAYEKSVQEVLPQGTVGGKAIKVAPRGYSGPIEILVGIDGKGKIVGIKVLSQRETPGLGANVSSPKFLKQFIGKNAQDPIEPKKDIDAITGATITSRAACQGVKEALKKAKL